MRNGNYAEQIIVIGIWATPSTIEKFDDIFPKNDTTYEYTDLEEIEDENNEGFAKYEMVWHIYGWTKYYPSYDWYTPDEWECSEEFIGDKDEVVSIINDYAKSVGIDTDLYDIDYIHIGEIENI